jgi:hypothetical protein
VFFKLELHRTAGSRTPALSIPGLELLCALYPFFELHTMEDFAVTLDFKNVALLRSIEGFHSLTNTLTPRR